MCAPHHVHRFRRFRRLLLPLLLGWAAGCATTGREGAGRIALRAMPPVPESQLAADRAILAAVDDTLTLGRISDDVWKQCVEHVGPQEVLIEMVVAIGNWNTFSQLLRSLDIPLEDGVQAWPPDGIAPKHNKS